MNCEAYIAIYRGEYVTLYPQNIESEIINELCEANTQSGDFNHNYLVIKRIEDTVYYAYIAPCDDLDSKVVVMTALTGVLIDDTLELNTCLHDALTGIATHTKLLRYDAETGIFMTGSQTFQHSNLQNAREQLREMFNQRFADKGIHLGSHDYTRTPGADILLMGKDGSWMRFSTQSAKTYGHLSLRQSIEAGNTVVLLTRKAPKVTEESPEVDNNDNEPTTPTGKGSNGPHLSSVILGFLIIILLFVVIPILIYNNSNRANDDIPESLSYLPATEEVAPEAEPAAETDTTGTPTEAAAPIEDDGPSPEDEYSAAYQTTMSFLNLIENYISQYSYSGYSAEAEDKLHKSIVNFYKFLYEELDSSDLNWIMSDQSVINRWREVANQIPDVVSNTMSYSRDAQSFINYFAPFDGLEFPQ